MNRLQIREEDTFIHLRVHTCFSLLEGAVRIEDLVSSCVKENMPAVAMTDTMNMFGSMEISQVCSAEGIKPIIGCQLGIGINEEGSFSIRSSDSGKKVYNLVLLVKDEVGYKNLIKLCSLAHLNTTPPDLPHIDIEELKKHNEGLILLTGGSEGLIGKLLQYGKLQKAETILDDLKEFFSDRLYIELQRHGLEVEEQTEGEFLRLAYEKNIPLVATNEVFFIGEDMFEAQDAMMCIADKTYVDTLDRRRLTPEHRFKSSKEMIELFKDLPEAIHNTIEIAKRCSFLVEKKPPALPHYILEAGETEAGLLRKKSEEGLRKRLSIHVFTSDMSEAEKEEISKPYWERLNYELSIIEQMKFPGYFLIVSDFIQWSKAHDIPVGPGRGSGAGSVVAWALTITDLDPLRFNLLFERFLNPERVSMPDFDVDFCQEKRGETIEYVRRKYGFDHVAQIITFGKLQARAVLRDVGRVFQIPYPIIDRLSKLVPNDPGSKVSLKEIVSGDSDFKRECEKEAGLSKVLEIAVKLEGLYRNASTHAAGVVIGEKALDEILPLYRDPASDMPVTQFDMKWVESTGLIKFDFLGLKTLTTIANAVRLLAKRGVEVKISEISLDDKETYELLQRADTAGVFQLESSGMRKILRDLKPDKLEDVIAIVALFRPGPMDNIPSYINRKHGKEKSDYLHPMLEGILKETYGIMIYQEQVMQIAQVMAGYSLGGADLLRRAMGKKKKEEMIKQQSIFVEGALKKGVEKEQAANIFAQMEKFAGYGFNKSHAAAYALIAYQTAYLKAHYPVEFMAATMSMDILNSEKLSIFKRELSRMGIPLLAPDINKAGVKFTVEGGSVRYALNGIKNVGEGAMEAVILEREKNGVFKSITDFINRVDSRIINHKCLENLIKAGSFDSILPNRALLLNNVQTITHQMSLASEDRKNNQINLFGDFLGMKEIELEPTEEWSLQEKLSKEVEAVGFYLSAHPLDEYNKSLDRIGIRSFLAVSGAVIKGGSARVKLAGIVNNIKERTSKAGNRYAFITASDSSGSYEMVCFSDVLSTSRDKLNSGRALIFSVNVDKESEDMVSMTLQSVTFLEEVISKSLPGIEIKVNSLESIKRLQEVLLSVEVRGQTKITLFACLSDWEVPIELKDSYQLTSDILMKIRNIPGVLEIIEV